MLHVVVICADRYKNQPNQSELKPLAVQLQSQLWGLLPGFHRLVFEGGQVLLTLCIGSVLKVLRQQQFEADVINLNATALAVTELLQLVKATAKLCKLGTVLKFQPALSTPFLGRQKVLHAAFAQCGFIVGSRDAAQTISQAIYNPAWAGKLRRRSAIEEPNTCVVVGAGLAGAAVANSLARRGWQVVVLDSASEPASGASGLPAGLLVAHTSVDDSLLSRLSRCGVRITLEQAKCLLLRGTHWAQTGVLERSMAGTAKSAPRNWPKSAQKAVTQTASQWCCPPTFEQLHLAGLPPTSAAMWHKPAGWIQPASLVKAWLATSGVEWRGRAHAACLKPSAQGWQVFDAAGVVLADARLVVLACGPATPVLAGSVGVKNLSLQAIRGQVTWGLQGDLKLPPFPVNGHGSLTAHIPSPAGDFWLTGSTYERGVDKPHLQTEDNAQNFKRLHELLPQAAAQLAVLKPNDVKAWSGVRCATPTRLPLVSRISASINGASVWACTGMGSRGLTFAALCAELLAAQLHHEPLPVTQELAKALTLKQTQIY